MKCKICGEEIDQAELALVFLHEHNEDLNPSIAIGIKGKEVYGKSDTDISKE